MFWVGIRVNRESEKKNQQLIFIFPQTKFRGYIRIALSVCLSVCLSARLCNRVRSISFLCRNIGSFYFTQRLLITWGCVMILTHGHLGKFKVTGRKSAKYVFGQYLFYGESLEVFSSRSMEGKVQNSCTVYIFLMEKYWKFLLHIIIAYDLRVCHDIDTEVQCSCLKMHNSRIGKIL